MSDYHINIFLSEEDGGYIADVPDLVACSAFGATPAEALAELELARAAWLDGARLMIQVAYHRAPSRTIGDDHLESPPHGVAKAQS